MHILMTWREAFLNISGFLLAADDGYDSKSCWYFKTQVCRVQCGFECIQRPLPKIALYGYVISTTSKVMYSVRGLKLILLKVAKKMISAWLSLSMRTLVTSHLAMWIVITMSSVCGNEVRLMSWKEKVIGIYDHLVWVMGPSTAT
jgi:hypothetical protein